VLDEDSAPPKRDQPHFSAHVYCGQTAVWIKMPLGRKVGLGAGHIVLGEASKRGTAPNFRPMSIVAKRSPISAILLNTCFKMAAYRHLVNLPDRWPPGLCSAAVTLYFLFIFIYLFFNESWSKEISEPTRPIFAKF